MLDRSEMLATIDKAYDARVKGDKSALNAFFTPDATYYLAGSGVAPGIPHGQSNAQTTIGSLMDIFTFLKMERVSAMVDGDTAILTWRVDLKTDKKGPAITEFCDFWQFGEDGKITSLRQYIDTAQASSMLS